jgi:hypothetical protein
MWGDNPTTAYLVLGLGNFGGGVAKARPAAAAGARRLGALRAARACGESSGAGWATPSAHRVPLAARPSAMATHPCSLLLSPPPSQSSPPPIALHPTPQGVTGFGSAIINLCVWIVFKCAGVPSGVPPRRAAAARPRGAALPAPQSGRGDAHGPRSPASRRPQTRPARPRSPPPGTLQQAVVSEALASTFIAPGLLYATQAHRNADAKLVASISTFVVRAGPTDPGEGGGEGLPPGPRGQVAHRGGAAAPAAAALPLSRGGGRGAAPQ